MEDIQDIDTNLTPAWDMGMEWGYASAARIVETTGAYKGITNDAYDAIAPKVASFLRASTAEEGAQLNLGIQVGIMRALEDFSKRTVIVGVPIDGD